MTEQKIFTASASETCGSCRFARFEDMGLIECRGVPPTPVVLGMGQNLAGKQGANVQLLRARLPATEAACALYREVKQFTARSQ